MTPTAQAARDAAVAALEAAGWGRVARDVDTLAGVVDGIASIHDQWGRPADIEGLTALHALFVLGAALTAPSPTCAPGCVRFAAEGAGHPGACGVPETGGGR